jgi:hypothetical protein
MLDLLGDADRHLRQVENHFPGVQFVARGDEISLTGATSEVDDARRVFDELMILVRGFLPNDHFNQWHLVHRREEMKANELPGSFRCLCQASDWQGRCIAGKNGCFGYDGLGAGSHSSLDADVFKYGLNNQLTSFQVCIIRRGMDQV